MVTPASSTSAMVVRAMFLMGVTQRSISSTAVSIPPSRSAASRSFSSGNSSSTCMPPVITCRVVSSPPIRIRSDSCTIDSSSRRSPSTSASQRMLTRSSPPGRARRSAITPIWNSRNAIPARAAFSEACGLVVVVPRMRSSDHSSRSSNDSLGKPSMSPMSNSGSGAAMSHTKSHTPRSQTRSMIRSHRPSISASLSRTRFGVNPRLTSFRRVR